jgi:SAM-dependent methyltransferase
MRDSAGILEVKAITRLYTEGQQREPREAEYIVTHWQRYVELWQTTLDLLRPPKKILEVGTLFGHIAMGLQALGYETEALDDPREARRYHRQIEEQGIRETFCDIERDVLPYPSGTFDAVVLAEVLEHLNPLRLQYVMSEIGRIIKTGGYLVATTPNQFNLGARIRMLIGHKYLCPQHTREYSLKELDSIIQGGNIFYASGINDMKPDGDTGLRIMKSWYSLSLDEIDWGPRSIRLARSLLWPFKAAYPRFRGTIFIVAVKK